MAIIAKVNTVAKRDRWMKDVRACVIFDLSFRPETSETVCVERDGQFHRRGEFIIGMKPDLLECDGVKRPDGITAAANKNSLGVVKPTPTAVLDTAEAAEIRGKVSNGSHGGWSLTACDESCDPAMCRC